MKYSFLIEAADCCSNILSQFRIDAGLSRKDMSQVMDVSETTIKAWETGQGSPTLLGMLLWFQATGNSAAPPLVKLFWPDEIGNTSIHSSYDEIRSALAYYLANLASPEEVAKLHYLMYGGHGSSWLGLLDMGLAHVNASLDSRVRIRETIMTSYSLCEASGRLQTPPGLSVNRAVIESVKVAAQDAVAGHLQGDTITPVTLQQKENYSTILVRSRMDAGVTQREMAKAMGKTERTIQNWESNCSPTFLELRQWFYVLDISPWPYIRPFLYPSEDACCSCPNTLEKRSLIQYIQTCPEDELKRFAYLIGGSHGSEWYAVLEMLFVHVCEPLPQRIISARSILLGYTLDSKSGKIRDPLCVQPDLANLNACIDRGIEAAMNHKSGYV